MYRDQKRDVVLAGAGLVLAVTCGAALYFSFQAYTLTRSMEGDQRDAIQSMQQELKRLAQQAGGANRPGSSWSEPATGSSSARSSSGQKGPVSSLSSGSGSPWRNAAGGPSGRPDDTFGMGNNAPPQSRAFAGGDTDRQRRPGQGGGPDQPGGKQQGESDAETEAVRAQFQVLMEKNKELHQTDKDRYGAELNDLYSKARPLRGETNDPEAQAESDQAFATLISQYPEANATGMVIAERALGSALAMNTADVEKYYSMLKSKENFSGTVTDNGIEAVPTLQVFMARNYLQTGNKKAAEKLVTDLAKNYPDSLVSDRELGSGQPVWIPASKVLFDLQNQIKGGGSAPTAPSAGR